MNRREGFRRILLAAYLGMIAFSLAGSLAARFAHLESSAISQIASAVVLGLGAASIALEFPKPATLALLMLLATTIEWVGVCTGFPFGHYSYTGSWAPNIVVAGHSFPALLPLAWLLIVGGCRLVIGPSARGFPAVLFTAASSTLIDIGLEDTMVNSLGYWKWIDHGLVFGAPIQNSVGWFATAALCSFVLEFQTFSKVSAAPLVLAAYFLLLGEIAFLHGSSVGVFWLVSAAAVGAVYAGNRRQSRAQ